MSAHIDFPNPSTWEDNATYGHNYNTVPKQDQHSQEIAKDSVRVENGNGSTSCENDSESNEYRGWRRYIGFALTLVSGILYALASLIVKLLHDYHPFLISIWRFQGVLIPCLVVILVKICFQKKYVFDSVWPLKDKEKSKAFYILMLRGFLGTWGVVLQFYSLQYLSVADSMVITSSTSVFVTMMAHCFIGERCALIPIITAILTFGGVFVISRPPFLTGKAGFELDILIGVAMAVGCMFISATNIVIQRYLREVHYSVISFSSGVWGTVQCVVLAFIVDEFEIPRSVEHGLLAVGLGAVTLVAQVAIVVALKYEQAGPVAVVQSCDVIFAFAWQFALLGVAPDHFSLIGSFIIVIGLLLTALRKCLTVLPQEHKVKKTFRFLLI